MSALDFVARAMAAREHGNDKRLATLATVARGIAENLPKGLPVAMGVPIAEARNAATQIAAGTTYTLSSTTPATNFISHYGLYGAEWPPNAGGTFEVMSYNAHSGNGSNPALGALAQPGGVTRFMTQGDKFEIVARNTYGFRVKVNGKYCKTGMYGVAALNGDTANAIRHFLFDFAGTEFAGAGLKLVEIQWDIFGYFDGVRVPVAYTVAPWAKALPLKAALHGDSMVSTVSDGGTDHRTALHGQMPMIVQTLTGLPDIWNNSIGGIGFVYDAVGTKSNFVEQAGVDFSGEKFDLVWQFGGRNDVVGSAYVSEAAYRDTVASWIAIVLADNPDTVIIMTGPQSAGTSENYAASAAFAAMQRGQKAACALYPRNCAFIETIGNAALADPWVFGTGKRGTTTGNGNSDLVTGDDSTHPTVFGHQYRGTRLVTETARVIPLLASRIRDGVIAGVNDFDVV